jgi:dimethylargininase
VVVDDLAVLTRPGARQPAAATVDSVRERPSSRSAAHRARRGAGHDRRRDGAAGRQHRVRRAGRAATPDAVEQLLARHLAPLGRRVVAVPVLGCLHLKTGRATALAGLHRATIPGGWTSSRSSAPAELLEVPEPSGADVVLSGERVVLSAAAPATAALVRERGFEVHEVDISELEKAECGPTCLSVLVPR